MNWSDTFMQVVSITAEHLHHTFVDPAYGCISVIGTVSVDMGKAIIQMTFKDGRKISVRIYEVTED